MDCTIQLHWEMSSKKALRIMGRNGVSLDAAFACYGTNPSIEERRAFSCVPFPTSMLRKVAGECLLVIDCGISISQLVESHGCPVTAEGRELLGKSFAQSSSKPQWRLINTIGHERLLKKDYRSQRSLAGSDIAVPSARTLANVLFVQQQLKCQWLSNEISYRSASCDEMGNRIEVAWFFDRLSLRTCNDGQGYELTGLGMETLPLR